MVNRYYTDSVSVLRYYSSNTTRGVGGQLVKSYTTYLDVTGSFQNAGGNLSMVNDIDAFRKTKMFYCDVVDIVDTDRIRYSSHDYTIDTVNNVWGHHLEVALRIIST